MLWIYNLHDWALGLLIAVVCLALSAAGVLIVGPLAKKAFADQEGWREHVSITLEAAFVFVGLLLALVTIAAYDNFSEARTVVSNEASAAGILYRDVAGYPQPTSTVLQGLLQQYVTETIAVDWPEQQRGVVPAHVTMPTQIINLLEAYQPATPGQTAVSSATLTQANAWLQVRRERLELVTRGLPDTLWIVLVLGALINIALTWLLPIKSARGHLILSGAFALVVGLILFVTASMDHPFRGEFSVSPEAFVIIRDDVMAYPGA